MNATIQQRAVTQADLDKLTAMLNERDEARRIATTSADLLAKYPDLNRAEYVVEVGPKYAHLIRRNVPSNGGSSAGMIDMATGDIYACAGYGKVNKKAPKATNGVRGNIFAEDGGASTFGDYGVQYTARYLNSRAGRF